MDVLKIILGVAATLVATVAGFYVTSSLSLAQKQLVAATRLSGYLTYWQNWILEHDLFFSIYHHGMVWNEEDREIRKRGGGPKETLALEKDKRREFLIHVKEGIEKANFEVPRGEVVRNFQRLPKEAASLLVESLKATRQGLLDGKTFISDEEAATLGVAFTNKCIELKMGILDLVSGGTLLLLSVANAPADFDVKSFSTEISDLAWKGILVSKNIDAMAPAARAISSKTVVALTLQNLRTGSRLTKR